MLIISCATVCLAQAEVSSRVSVRRHPDYLHLTQALRELVSQNAKTERNSFYVSHVNIFKNGYHSAWVYWKEAGVIILLEPDHAAFDPKYDLVWSRRYLHLDKDVVPTLDDVGGSNYLLTREDAREIVAECKRGDKYVILKSTRRWQRRNLRSYLQIKTCCSLAAAYVRR